jgi:surface protein
MFRVASAFNQPIGDWNTAAVTNMQAMFDRASAFNQNISYQDGTPKWDTSGVTNMASMFNSATVFNNGQGAGGNSARLNWRTTGITPPVSNFRASSALTAENSENDAESSTWYV